MSKNTIGSVFMHVHHADEISVSKFYPDDSTNETIRLHFGLGCGTALLSVASAHKIATELNTYLAQYARENGLLLAKDATS